MSKLLKGNVLRHLIKPTLPGVWGMLAIMIFNLTDTWFVSRLGTQAYFISGKELSKKA